MCGKPFEKTLSAKFCSTPDKEKACSLRIEDKLDIVEVNPNRKFELYKLFGRLFNAWRFHMCQNMMMTILECNDNTNWSFGKIAKNIRKIAFARLAELKEKFNKEK